MAGLVYPVSRSLNFPIRPSPAPATPLFPCPPHSLHVLTGPHEGTDKSSYPRGLPVSLGPLSRYPFDSRCPAPSPPCALGTWPDLGIDLSFLVFPFCCFFWCPVSPSSVLFHWLYLQLHDLSSVLSYVFFLLRFSLCSSILHPHHYDHYFEFFIKNSVLF